MKKEKTKSIDVHFRLTAYEYAATRIAASREERNFSEMLREFIREGAQRRGLTATDPIGEGVGDDVVCMQ